MANLWQQGVQENKSSWQNSSTADKAGKIGQGVGALSSIVSSSISLAKGNKAALDEVKNEAKGVNQQKVDSGSLDSIYDIAKNYESLNTHHDWQEFFANGGYLNNPYGYYEGYPLDYYDYLTLPRDYYGNTYGAGGKIASAGLSNTANGAMAGMKIGGPWGAVIGGAVGLVGTAVGSIFGHSKAKKMAREANEAAEEANNGMAFKINSAIDDNAHNTLQSYENALPYAFGGLLGDMGAVNYGLASDYLNIKDKQTSNKQTPLSYLGNSYIREKPVTVFDDNNSFANGGGINIKKSHEGLFVKQAKEEGMDVQEFANHVLANKDKYSSSTVRRATFARNASNWNKDGRKPTRYALGGDMQTNGSDFTDGLTEVNAGGTHEENPNGGVPMGVAPDNKSNLVEEGETIYNDYVFSNRIEPDKEALKKFHIYSSGGNLTYADLSKRLEKEAKERPNDPISKDGLNAQLAKLAQEQERQKAEEEEKRAKAAFEALSPQEKERFIQEMAKQQEAQAMQEQQAQQQAAQQEGQEGQEVSPEEAQMQEQQVSSEEQAAMQQQMEQQQALEQQQAMDANAGNANEGYAEGGELHKFDNGGKKHVGTWKKGWDEKKAWESYARPALERILIDAEARLKGVSNPIERRRIQEDIVNKFNSIQRSYADSYQSPEGAYTYNDKVKQHQLNWGQIGGNNAYYPGEGFGIADRINLPKGANTKDKYDTWNDGYWGPITSTRNLGSTLYGNDKFYAPYIKEFDKLGIRFGANKDYSYNNGNNQLYTLSLTEDPDVLKPVNPKTPEKINVPNITIPNQVTPTGNNNSKQLPTWPRYAGLFGPAVGLGMQALGIGKDPGKKAYNSAFNAISSTGNPTPTHIGDYVRYTPFDLWQAQNKADAARLATDRAIMNNSGPIGAKISGLVANANNYYQGNGTLVRQAQEYNNKNMMDVANFNRGTHQFNASADNQFALTANQNKQWRAQALMNYAAQKAAQEQQWYDSLYGNVNNLLKGISDYGRENMVMNQVNANVDRGTWGNVGNNEILGSLGGSRQMHAKGGKITKKKRRGYTF